MSAAAAAAAATGIDALIKGHRLNRKFHELRLGDQILVTRYVIETRMEDLGGSGSLRLMVPYPTLLGKRRCMSIQDTCQRLLLEALSTVESTYTDARVRMSILTQSEEVQVIIKVDLSPARRALAEFLGTLAQGFPCESSEYDASQDPRVRQEMIANGTHVMTMDAKQLLHVRVVGVPLAGQWSYNKQTRRGLIEAIVRQELAALGQVLPGAVVEHVVAMADVK
jgi:hypothetical protein